MNPNKANQSLKLKKIHFIGIGGIGMSALARYFYSHGYIISGSDKEDSTLIYDLQKEGIKNIWTPHNKQRVEEINPDYVIYSTAVTSKNEEFVWAKENKKNILHRAELLEMATSSKKLISISGTHGKTTTTAMLSELLIDNKFDPSVILGGILISKNTNAISGTGDYFVVEADESDKSHLKGNPEISVITNIEADHLENYSGSFEEIKKSFVLFSKKAMQNKGLIACLDDKITKEIVLNNFNLDEPKLITYGINKNNSKAKIQGSYNSQTKHWDIFIEKKYMTSVKLRHPGEHNILNALAAFSAGYLLGINVEKIKQSLENYQGVKRRFQILGNINDITVIDDYAHHPTEIAFAIKSAKELNSQRLIVILQPHQPIRLKDLWKEFTEVLKQQEDLIFVTDTYIARGGNIEGISSKKLIEEIGKPNIKYLAGNTDQIADYIKKIVKSKDLILIMGAGDITKVGPLLLKSPGNTCVR